MPSQLTILHLYSKTFPGGGPPHDPLFPRGICHNPQTLWWAFTYKRLCNPPPPHQHKIVLDHATVLDTVVPL